LLQPIQIVFLNFFENCRSPFKNETLHQERSQDGQKNTRELLCTKFLQSSESSCWCTYEGIQKQMANNSLRIPIRIGNTVTDFQLPLYEYH
jgi:hypothetical protein